MTCVRDVGNRSAREITQRPSMYLRKRNCTMQRCYLAALHHTLKCGDPPNHISDGCMKRLGC